MRMRIDTQHWFEQLLDILGRCKSQKAKMEVFSVAIGANIIAGYLNDIAKCAVRIGDKELLDLCEGMLLIEKDGDGK